MEGSVGGSTEEGRATGDVGGTGRKMKGVLCRHNTGVFAEQHFAQSKRARKGVAGSEGADERQCARQAAL